MGHQLNFYLTEKDTQLVEAEIRKFEPVTVFHSRSNSKQPRVLESLRYQQDEHSWLFFYVSRASDLESLPLHHVEGPNYWTPDIRRSPIIEFTRSFVGGTVIRRGRIYFINSYFDEAGALIYKDENFVKWGRKVINAVRKILIKNGTNYIGPEVKELLDRSEVFLEK